MIPNSIRDEVAWRDDFACVRCGRGLGQPVGDRAQITQTYSIHHRQPRGMGGSKNHLTNTPENLLLLCGSGTTGCHGYIEQHRLEAFRNGWLVERGTDPALVPVMYYCGEYMLKGCTRSLRMEDEK